MRLSLALFVLVPLVALFVVAIQSDIRSSEPSGGIDSGSTSLSRPPEGSVSRKLERTPPPRGLILKREAGDQGVSRQESPPSTKPGRSPLSLTPADINYALERLDTRSLLADVFDLASDLDDLPWTRGRWIPPEDVDAYDLTPTILRRQDDRLWALERRIVDGYHESRSAPFFNQAKAEELWSRYQRFVDWSLSR